MQSARLPLRRRALRASFAAACLMLLAPLQAQHSCRDMKRGAHGAPKGGAALWPWDILHERITLDLTLGNLIAGSCEVTATPREAGLDALHLDLLALTVDSVVLDGAHLAFTHTGEDLAIALPQAYGPGDTIALAIHYGGDPVTDPSGFGGFYTTSTYSYNLGVAFTSVPHSYGRAWFPCVDNFTERSTHEFIVTTALPWNAWCNGRLIGEWTPAQGLLTRHWRIDETMPSYLASVAAAEYAVVRDTLPSITGAQVPVTLVARPPDTTAMKASFLNLPIAFERFEDWFGPYRWERVGYVATPQGAMEHATSIHYPKSIVNGSLAYQDVMAHELGHHWFGDLVTCQRPEEMYLNEGFAEYMAYLFIEAVNGPQAYRDKVRANHRTMLLRAHIDDQGWWALHDVPQQWTYGTHVYDKGADVLHTLRSYLGDDAFRQGLTSFLDAHAFQPVGTTMLRDHLQQATGVPMGDFFDDWIMQPGWAAFEVEGMEVGPEAGDGTFPTTVTFQQKQRGPAQPFHQVPVSLSFMGDDGAPWTDPVPAMLGGPLCEATSAPPFHPRWAVINADERISLAMTADADSISGATTRIYTNSDFRLTVASTPAPFKVRVEEYWVAADDEAGEPFAYVVSPDRYWRIIGSMPEEAQLSGRFAFDGRPAPAASQDSGLMQDFGSLPFREDSLVMLYRPGPGWPWLPHPDQVLSTLGSPTDRQGRIDVNGLRAGEYCFAWRKSAVGVPDQGVADGTWSISPNPARDRVEVRAPAAVQGIIEVRDARGRLVAWEPINGETASFSVQPLEAGLYRLRHVPAAGAPEPVGALVRE